MSPDIIINDIIAMAGISPSAGPADKVALSGLESEEEKQKRNTTGHGPLFLVGVHGGEREKERCHPKYLKY